MPTRPVSSKSATCDVTSCACPASFTVLVRLERCLLPKEGAAQAAARRVQPCWRRCSRAAAWRGPETEPSGRARLMGPQQVAMVSAECTQREAFGHFRGSPGGAWRDVFSAGTAASAGGSALPLIAGDSRYLWQRLLQGSAHWMAGRSGMVCKTQSACKAASRGCAGCRSGCATAGCRLHPAPLFLCNSTASSSSQILAVIHPQPSRNLVQLQGLAGPS